MTACMRKGAKGLKPLGLEELQVLSEAWILASKGVFFLPGVAR